MPKFVRRPPRPLTLSCALALGVSAPSFAQQAFAPAAAPPALEAPLAPVPSASRVVPVSAEAPPSDASRRAEFESLDREVAALEPQLGLIKRVVRLVTPSVVHIEARPVREHRIRSDAQEAGSGVVVRFGGRDYVLTNRHVIRYSSAPNIRIHLADGSPLVPTRVWSDADTDVAVMALDAAASTSLAGVVAPARLGDSDSLEIGEQVLAFGSPFGLSHSVTRGIVSAKGRYNLDLGDGDVKLQNFLQTDAAINPGNSGGPLVNFRGEVIGLNTAIASSSGGNEGIGFSIPINLAVRIAGQLVASGEPSRGFLGVGLESDFSAGSARARGLSRPVGALVTRVEEDSPAQLASIKTDDVILAFDGVRVEDDEHLINLVQLTESGRKVELELFRAGARLRTEVEIGRLGAISE
ncbi:MAG: S1C family serine protease [Lacipirellulaceae bacterium]